MKNLNRRPQPQQIYRHFKGNLYQIQCIANHSETGEEMVVYQALYGDYGFYVRPLSMFVEKVDRVKYPNVKQEYRFELVSGNKESLQSVNPVEDVQNKQNAQNIQVSPDLESDSYSRNNSDSPSIGSVSAPSESGAAINENGEVVLDEGVLKFLDADNNEDRLEILTGMKYRITDEMIDIMSTVIDIEVQSGDINKRYEDFKSAIMTRKHYEGRRLR